MVTRQPIDIQAVMADEICTLLDETWEVDNDYQRQRQ